MLAVVVLPLIIATLTVPPWAVFVDHAVFGYDKCIGSTCRTLCAFFALVFAYVAAVVPGVLTSLLWYAFGRPKPVKT